VRAACCYTKDPRLISDFTEDGKDPHGDTAELLFGVKKEMFKTPEEKAGWKKGMRDWTKNRFVFPQFFGSVYFQCAPSIWNAVEKGALMPDGKSTVMEHLAKQGIKVARRTVAKYREQLNILPSHLRKSF
jgi:hypothetical protein